MTFEDRCPWCSRYVLIRPGEPTPCPDCRHHVGVPRSCCECAMCRSRERYGAADGEPPPPAEGHAHGA